jgi:hypothetical protein
MSEPVEKLLGRWADSPNDKTRPSRVEVDSFATPSFPWFRRGLSIFLVQRIAWNERLSDADTSAHGPD